MSACARLMFLILLLAMTPFLQPASATTYCDIRKTTSGFVALRSAPSDNAKLVERMKPGDEVLYGQEKKGAWIEVIYWRGGRFASGKNPQGDPPTATGWMRASMIAEDSCG